MQPFKWTEDLMASALVDVSSISPKSLVVPRCNWGGHEKDLLIIDVRSRRLIDVEIKISRSDLKADAKKDKWFYPRYWARPDVSPRRRQWPEKCWKHYYALPREIWMDELAQFIPDASGVILVNPDTRFRNGFRAVVKRRAIPNRKAPAIGDGDILDIARLLHYRYWGDVRKAARISKQAQPTGDQHGPG